MSREIRFRAWDRSLKKMVYPKLWDNSMPSNWERWYDLMQFTGLHDKNGREVFEGDILHIGNDVFGFIKYPYEVKHEGCDFVLKRPDLPITWGRLSRLSELHWECEIIGNLHEHPELLTQ